jgi:hypothetical protein
MEICDTTYNILPLEILIFNTKMSAHGDGGPHSVCACLTVCLSPYQHEWEFYGAGVCKVAFKHLPKPLRSHIQIFRTLKEGFIP